MNERIDELARKAAGGMLSYDEDGYRLSEREVKKFAELIVRECIGIVGNNNPCPPGTIKMYSLLQDEYFDKGWQVAVETKSNQIKKHFGVENE